MGAGTYAFIDTGVIGTDEIKVALIYKPAAVTPVGAFKIITTATDPRFIDTRNRPSLAQTFEQDRDRRAADGRRQPPQVEGLRLQRRRRPRHRRRLRATATSPARTPPRRSSTGSPPTRPAAATPTSCSSATSTPTPSRIRSTGSPTHGYTNLVRAVRRPDPVLVRLQRRVGLPRPRARDRVARGAGDRHGRLAHQPRRADRARLQHRVQDAQPGQHVLRPGPVPLVRPRPGHHRPPARQRRRRSMPADRTRSSRAGASSSARPARSRGAGPSPTPGISTTTAPSRRRVNR